MIEGKLKGYLENRELEACSVKFQAVLAFLVGMPPITNPGVTGICVTSDNHVLLATTEDPFYNDFTGWSYEELLGNINGLCDAGEIPSIERALILSAVPRPCTPC